MNRETKELSTLSGKKVVIYSYLSAREMQTVNAAVIGDQKTDGADGARVALPIAAGLVWEKKILEAAITSFDGKTEKPVEAILDLPNEEYTDLKDKVYTLLKINLKRAK